MPKQVQSRNSKKVAVKEETIDVVDNVLTSLLGNERESRRKNVRLAFRILIKGPDDSKLAELYKQLAGHRFKYDKKQKAWYLINEYNIWDNEPEGHRVKNDIRVQLSSFIEVVFNKTNNLLKELSSKYKRNAQIKNEIKQTMEMIDGNFNSVTKYLNNQAKKKACLAELKGLCNEIDVFTAMDSVNMYLFAFTNGVYDLKNGIFRLPTPQELVSVTCGYDYDVSDKKGLEIAKNKLREFMLSLFETEEDHNTIVSEIAYSLDGDPNLEQFYVWIGGGANGKTTLSKIIKATFGAYYKSVGIAYFCKVGKENNGTAADPVMASLKDARYVGTSEPDNNVTLKMDLIKQMTGQDEQSCRHLFRENFSFTPKCRIFFQSNYDVKIEGASGHDIIRRVKCRRFPYKFCNKPIEAHEKKGDTSLKVTLRANIYKMAFFLYLLPFYNKFVERGRKVKESKSSILETKRLLQVNDPFGEFIEDYVEKTTDMKDKLKISEIKKKFDETRGENGDISGGTIKQTLVNRGFKVTRIKGYDTCSFIKINLEKIASDANNVDAEENINIDFVSDDEPTIIQPSTKKSKKIVEESDEDQKDEESEYDELSEEDPSEESNSDEEEQSCEDESEYEDSEEESEVEDSDDD